MYVGHARLVQHRAMKIHARVTFVYLGSTRREQATMPAMSARLATMRVVIKVNRVCCAQLAPPAALARVNLKFASLVGFRPTMAAKSVKPVRLDKHRRTLSRHRAIFVNQEPTPGLKMRRNVPGANVVNLTKPLQETNVRLAHEVGRQMSLVPLYAPNVK